ncbi:unnamed protein product [Clonostachys chloroleuca]|uniref:Heterokaryon incompatibility domain-containing protein n=1 Tax=Clonostachys chloroleuca TaxID=1926264 RepID=A0AA35MAR9_9HYPO|nr:unnamed protein product [Clonostachys chloroleuca]
MVKSYDHQPLESHSSIRVLSVAPARLPDAQIECHVRHIDLKKNRRRPSYEALSYVWGSPKGTIPILCDGDELLVTPNCLDALKRLRLPQQSRTLWIDAICIDQRETLRSTRERIEQVKMMGEIYEGAKRVLVWLGPCEDLGSSAKLFSLMKESGNIYNWQRKSKLTSIALKPVATRLEEKFDGASNESRRYRQSLTQLLESPWFTRAWTVQEVAFSKRCTIFYGPLEISWRALADVSSYFCKEIRTNHTGKLMQGRQLTRLLVKAYPKEVDGQLDSFSNKLTLSLHQKMQSQDRNLFGLISMLSTTVAQDRIYGLYAVFRRMGINIPEPNYSKSVEEIFEETARTIISGRENLMILLSCVRPEGYTSLPSWVPEWTKPYQLPFEYPDLSGVVFFRNSKSNSASSASNTSLATAQDKGKLGLRGLIIYRIKSRFASSVVGSLDDHVANNGGLEIIRVHQQYCRAVQVTSQYSDSDGRIEAAGRTLLRAHLFKGEELKAALDPSFRYWYDLMLYPDCTIYKPSQVKALAKDSSTGASEVIRDYLLHCASSDDKSLEGQVWEIHAHILGIANYGLLIFDSGHLGLAFHNCREGDVVGLLAGSYLPVILRESGDSCHRFVAPAYVHGLMGGEGWPEDESSLIDILLI